MVQFMEDNSKVCTGLILLNDSSFNRAHNNTGIVKGEYKYPCKIMNLTGYPRWPWAQGRGPKRGVLMSHVDFKKYHMSPCRI